VDEGISDPDRFATPDPVEYFFGKKRLQVELRDPLRTAIDGKIGRRGEIPEGGDGGLEQRGRAEERADGRGCSPAWSRSARTAKAKVAFEFPDYNGRLRLMAVAYDEKNVAGRRPGWVCANPVIAELSVPRFLAPGDKSICRSACRTSTVPPAATKRP
jgi:uncharacterized protein YfaS (alpha-2-macroglobulin family)